MEASVLENKMNTTSSHPAPRRQATTTDVQEPTDPLKQLPQVLDAVQPGTSSQMDIDHSLRNNAAVSATKSPNQKEKSASISAMELELIDLNASPSRVNTVSNNALKGKTEKTSKKKKTTTTKSDGTKGKTIQGKVVSQYNSMRQKVALPTIEVPRNYIQNKMPSTTALLQEARPKATGGQEITGKGKKTKDPYSLDDEEEEEDWGLDEFGNRLQRNSGIDAKMTFGGKRRGRVSGMEKTARKKANKRRQRSSGLSTSTLAFGNQLEAAGMQSSRHTNSSRKRIAEEKWRKKTANLKVLQINEDSEDDECFLCKYRMKEQAPPF